MHHMLFWNRATLQSTPSARVCLVERASICRARAREPLDSDRQRRRLWRGLVSLRHDFVHLQAGSKARFELNTSSD